MVPWSPNIMEPRAVAIGSFKHLSFWGSWDELFMFFNLRNRILPQKSECCYYEDYIRNYNVKWRMREFSLAFSTEMSVVAYPSFRCVEENLMPFICGGLIDSISAGVNDDVPPLDKWK